MLEKIKKALEEKYSHVDFVVVEGTYESYSKYEAQEDEKNEITLTVPPYYDGLYKSIGYEVSVLIGEFEGFRPSQEDAEQAGIDFEMTIK